MRRSLLVVVAGLLGGWSPLASQSSSPPATFGDRVVVTASLEPEREERVTATVDVVTADEIEARQARLVLDLLRTMPALALTQSGSAGKVASLLTRGTNSAHTLVVLDGVTLNDPVLGAFDAAAWTTGGLERIEIVRGPFSALWGSSAVGGVVQLVTRRDGGRTLALEGEAGADGYRRAGATAAAPLGPVAFDLAGHLRRGDGSFDNDFFASDGGRLRLGWQAAPGVRLSPLVLVQDNEIGLPFDFTGAPSPHQRQTSETTLAALPVTAALGPWQLEAQLAQSNGSLAIADADDPFAASSSETRRESARGVVSRRFGDEVWLGAGLDWQRETAATASAFGAGLDDARQRTAAAFAQGSWARGPLRFDLGLRRDDNDAFGGATSLKTGAVIELAPGARLRASYGESFRAPALGDLYFPGFGNPALEPERGESWELAGELERGALRARVAGFHNDLDQLIQFDFARALPFNIGRARTRGVEGSLELRPGRFRARADGQWLEAEDRATGAPLPRRAEWSAALVAAWQGERVDLGAAWRLVGEREDVGRQPLAGHTVVDLTAAHALGHGLSAFARLGNALDRDYQEAIGYPAPGRSWAAGLALRVD